MVKLIASGIWVVVVALVAVYFSVQMALAPKVDKEAEARRAAEETIRGELTSLPVIQDGDVQGYFLTKLSYVVDKVKMANVHIPIDVLINDQLFTLLVGNKMVDISNHQNFDVPAFRKAIQDAINKRLGDDVVHDVMIEQIDFLSKKDIRSNMEQKNLNIKGGAPIVKEGAVAAPGAENKPVAEGETAPAATPAEGH